MGRRAGPAAVQCDDMPDVVLGLLAPGLLRAHATLERHGLARGSGCRHGTMEQPTAQMGHKESGTRGAGAGAWPPVHYVAKLALPHDRDMHSIALHCSTKLDLEHWL